MRYLDEKWPYLQVLAKFIFQSVHVVNLERFCVERLPKIVDFGYFLIDLLANWLKKRKFWTWSRVSRTCCYIKMKKHYKSKKLKLNLITWEDNVNLFTSNELGNNNYQINFPHSGYFWKTTLTSFVRAFHATVSVAETARQKTIRRRRLSKTITQTETHKKLP